MTISATSWMTSAATDAPSVRDARSDDDHARDFAGILAGVVHAPAQKIEPKKIQDGTSELDRPEEGATEPGDEKKTAKTDDTPSVIASTDATPAKNVHPLTTEIIQSMGALNPELQAKLARVMSRVHDETGHDVKVAETYRTQDRQNALFAQGRETPGPVVTWTRNSKHTQGRAVDLVLDDGTAGFDAYATLQRIAKEEGLHTLGARDPGHVELAGRGANLVANATTTNHSTPLIPAAPADASGPGQVSHVSIGRLAQVAKVAQVIVENTSQVAQVAQPARVASVGRMQASPAMIKSALVNPVGTRSSQGGHGAQAAPSTTEDTKDTSKSFSGDSNDQDNGNGKGEQRGGYSTLAAAVSLRDAAPSHTNIGRVIADHGVSSAARSAEVIAALQDAPARPLSQITMTVDAGNGTTDRIQVALRGSSLNATIDAGDAQRAQTMTSRSDELVRALSRDGIDVESLRVRAVAGATVTAAASSSHTANDSHTSSRSERHDPWQQQQDRQRQEERRQQQRDQRGGQEK